MTPYAGFDLGGSHLKYGLITKDCSVVYQSSTPTPEKIEELISLLQFLWEELKRKTNESISAVGFGFPGIFSHKEQKIFQSPNYQGIGHFDLQPSLAAFIDVPFAINNDANMAAYGEFKAGAGKNSHSMVLLTIGTGVGTGIILEGKLWQGACGFAGELGHAPVNPNGDKCNCGSQGCLETEVSAPKIVRNYKAFSGSTQNLTSLDVYLKAKKENKAALKSFSEAGKYLGIGFSIAINLLNPEKLIVGGGVMEAKDFILPDAIKEASKRSFKGSFDCCQILPSSLGNQSGFIGAACWARDSLK